MLKDNLVMLRNMHGFSQEEIAEKINISRQAYAKWESGATIPDVEKCRLLAEVYGNPVKVRSEHNAAGSAEIVLRPEAIEINDQGQLPCKVELSCFMGSYQNYHVRVGDTLVKIADNCPIGKKTFQVGDNAFISFRSECAHLLET